MQYFKNHVVNVTTISYEKSLSIGTLQAPGDEYKFSKTLIDTWQHDFYQLAMGICSNKLCLFTFGELFAQYPGLNMFFQHVYVLSSKNGIP